MQFFLRNPAIQRKITGYADVSEGLLLYCIIF